MGYVCKTVVEEVWQLEWVAGGSAWGGCKAAKIAHSAYFFSMVRFSG